MSGELGLPPGGGRAALTLLKFIQAAGAAEGAHRGRLPAAASLHPPSQAASKRSGATWCQTPGLTRTRAQLGGPPGGGGRHSRVPALRYHNAPLPPAPAARYRSPLTLSSPQEPRRTRAAAPPPPLPPRGTQPAPPRNPAGTRDTGCGVNFTFYRYV